MDELVSNKRKLVIPFPIKLTTMNGAHSLHVSGRPMAVRLHNDDIKLLENEAKYLGIPAATLMRWFIVYSTQQLVLVRTGNRPVIRP